MFFDLPITSVNLFNVLFKEGISTSKLGLQFPLGNFRKWLLKLSQSHSNLRTEVGDVQGKFSRSHMHHVLVYTFCYDSFQNSSQITISTLGEKTPNILPMQLKCNIPGPLIDEEDANIHQTFGQLSP